jgi:hypothetical protein
LSASLPRIGLLFDYDFDALEHARVGIGQYAYDRAGFDLFSFPSNVALAGFDIHRFARWQTWKAKARRWRAVVSHHEQFGALAAALVAEAAGLPGTSPEAIIACQHKLHARRVLESVCPEANVLFQALEVAYGESIPTSLNYPFFVKPVKAAFSVLAREVHSREELQAHTLFGPRELWVIRHLVEPFDRVARERLPESGSSHRLLIEEPMQAPQFNLDGYVAEGQVRVLGVTDAVMYPGTMSFRRWEVPTRLLPAVVQRAGAVAQTFLTAVGFTHGFFNMEFFYDDASARLSVIEFNPRMASQFSDLYRRVFGFDMHAMALALALGQDPEAVPRLDPTAGVAASLVWRSFTPDFRPAAPSRAQRAAFARTLPDAMLLSYPKSRSEVQRDFKWLESYRYGIVHLGASDRASLRARTEVASHLLGWPNAPYDEELPAA